jgi:hypothetical protein
MKKIYNAKMRCFGVKRLEWVLNELKMLRVIVE